MNNSIDDKDSNRDLINNINNTNTNNTKSSNTDVNINSINNISEFDKNINYSSNVKNKEANSSSKHLKNLLKNRTSFKINEKIHEEENVEIEFKNYNYPLSSELVKTITNQMNGFLNSLGGRIYFGITDEGIVKGITLTQKQRDLFKNDLVNYSYNFFPNCRTEKFEVSFIPIKNKNDIFINNLYIVKLLVKQGDTSKLYSISDKYFESYIRLDGQVAKLKSSEIMHYIIDRNNNPKKQLDPTEFIDPSPERPVEKEEEVLVLSRSNERNIFSSIPNFNNNINNSKISNFSTSNNNKSNNNSNTNNNVNNNINNNNVYVNSNISKKKEIKASKKIIAVKINNIPDNFTDKKFLTYFQKIPINNYNLFIDRNNEVDYKNKNSKKGWAYLYISNKRDFESIQLIIIKINQEMMCDIKAKIKM